MEVITFATIGEPVKRLNPNCYTVNKDPKNWDLNHISKRKTIVLGNTHDLDNLEITGYIRGDEIVFSPKLEWNHFDCVTFFNESKNVKADRKRLIFIGQQYGKEPVLILAKKKK